MAQLDCWQDVAAIYTSPEPKARLTGEAIAQRWGIPLAVVDDLGELQMMEKWCGHEEHLRKVGDYLEGVNDPDLEDYNSAQHRIVACIEQLLQDHPWQSIAVVSHGRILTVYFSHLLGHRLGRREWQSIAMPDLAVIDRSTGKVVSGFFKQDI